MRTPLLLILALSSCSLLDSAADSSLGDAVLLRGDFSGRASVAWTPRRMVLLSEADGSAALLIRNEIGDFVAATEGFDLDRSVRVRERGENSLDVSFPIEDDGSVLIPEGQAAEIVRSLLRPDQIAAWGIHFGTLE